MDGSTIDQMWDMYTCTFIAPPRGHVLFATFQLDDYMTLQTHVGPFADMDEDAILRLYSHKPSKTAKTQNTGKILLAFVERTGPSALVLELNDLSRAAKERRSRQDVIDGHGLKVSDHDLLQEALHGLGCQMAVANASSSDFYFPVDQNRVYVLAVRIAQDSLDHPPDLDASSLIKGNGARAVFR